MRHASASPHKPPLLTWCTQATRDFSCTASSAAPSLSLETVGEGTEEILWDHLFHLCAPCSSPPSPFLLPWSAQPLPHLTGDTRTMQISGPFLWIICPSAQPLVLSSLSLTQYCTNWVNQEQPALCWATEGRLRQETREHN